MRIKLVLIIIMSFLIMGIFSVQSYVKAINVTGSFIGREIDAGPNPNTSNDKFGQYELYYDGIRTSYEANLWDFYPDDVYWPDYGWLKASGYKTVFKVNNGGENVIKAPNASATNSNVTVTTSFQTIDESDGSKSILVIFSAKNNNTSQATVDISTFADLCVGDDDNTPLRVIYQNGAKIGFTSSNLKGNTSYTKVSLNYFFKNNPYIIANTQYLSSQKIWTGRYQDVANNKWNDNLVDINPDENHGIETEWGGWTDVAFAASWKLVIPAGQTGKVAYVLTTVNAASAYSINYNPNGGSGSSYTRVGNAWQSYQFENCTFTRLGYKCIGWDSNQNATTPSYTQGSTITLTNNMTLYAIWEKSSTPLTKPTLSGSYIYNGNTQTAILNNFDANTMNISGNTRKDAGSQNITISLKDTTNYTWSDGTTGNVTISWTIAKKSIAVNWGATTTFTYNGSAQAPTASATSGISGETINITRTTETNVGNYTSTASISSVTGGSASNYTLTSATKAFTIVARTISDGTLTFSDMEYTGTARNSTPVLLVAGKTLVKGIDYKITYEKNIESGMAIGTATGMGNYTGTISSRFLIYVNKTIVNVTGLTTGATETATATTGTDKTAPVIVVGSQKDATGNWSTQTAWSKTKDFTITATDAGTQIARIKFQTVSTLTDIYGITRRNVSANPVTNERDYQFTGDVTGYVTASIYLEDDNGNRKTEKLRIYNLDNTAPSITVNHKNGNKIIGSIAEINLKDNGSGVKYFAVTNATQTTEPTTYGNTNVTVGKELNYWYQVANNADTNPEDTTGRNVNVVFKNLDNGKYKIWAKDLLGNTSVQELEVENYPLITEWKVPANGTIKLPIPSNSGNNYIVDWGDDTYNRYTTEDFPSHTYSNTTETTYTIKINGNVNTFGNTETAKIDSTSNYYTFTQYLVGLKSWGKLGAERYRFSSCNNLSSTIPSPYVESFSNVTSMEHLFAGCSNLTGSIPSDLFINAPKVISFQYAFNNCTGLTGTIPTELFKNNTEVTDFAYTFRGCVKLNGSIPENLFSSCTKVTSFSGTFEMCENLTGSIPANLFMNCTDVTNFRTVFASCPGLTGSIPNNLFANCTKVTDFSDAFGACSNLTGTIPETLFTNCTEVTAFAGVFSGCSNLTGSIPANLFANNPKATNMSRAFAGCVGLTGHIPAELFKNNTLVTDLGSIFLGCSNLTSGEIRFNTAKITNEDFMFTGCSALESLAFSEDFAKLDGKNMFDDCTSLKAIILFKNANVVSEVPNLGTTEEIALPVQTIIYVPSKEAEKIYETAYQNRFADEEVKDELTGEMVTRNSGIRRIEPILALAGENPVYTQKGDQYVDAGYIVAGFEIAEESKYSIYGLTVAVTGLPVDTSTTGTKLVNYVLSHNGVSGMSLIRQVIVMELNFEKLEVLMNPNSYEYDGKEKMPKVYVKLDGIELIEGTDYSVEYLDNKNAGTGKVIINSMGIYKNNWTGEFTITPRRLIVTPEKGIVKFTGQEEPYIAFTISNQIEGEEPKYTGELNRDKAGTPEGEEAGEYTITQGTLQLINNGTFLVNNYVIEVAPEVVTVIGEVEKVFITKWQVTAGTTIQLPIPTNESNNYIVTWGDRTQGSYTTESFPTHTYEAGGEYEINIYGVCKNYGYVGEQIPSSNNAQKDYYTFTQYLVGIKQWGDIEAERFGFSYCTNLTGDIPKTTGFSKLTSMENMFNQCSSLIGPIPENFTADAWELVSARNLFHNCINLTGDIPADTFKWKSKVTTYENTFQNCQKLTGSIPGSLFEGAESVISYQATFKNCSGITGYLPQELFIESPLVETFRETFANCTGIKTEPIATVDPDFETIFIESTLPESFLYGNPKVRNYYRMFYNCTGLTGEVREELLSNNTRIRSISNNSASYSDYRGMFEGCTGIEKVSLGILSYGKEMFKNCTGIQEIDLRNTLELGESAFYGCNQLQNITIDENYFKVIGKDAFEYTGTDPQLLLTKVNRDNEVLLTYEWLDDNRILDVEAPKGTVLIEMDKDPFTNTQTVKLKLTVTDNYSAPENCEMAIINEDEYEAGVSYDELKWQPFAEEIEWNLTANDGAKVVFAYFKDEAGNICESLDYLAGKIKVVSNTGSLYANGPVEISLVSTFSGNNRQKNYHFRKEIKVYREGENVDFQEYFNPVTITEEGETYVEARFIETTTGIVIDEVMTTVSIDTAKPEKVTYQVIRGTLNGNIYYGEYLGKEDANNGVVIQVAEGKDYNALGEESYGIEEMRYTIVKDGNKIIEDEVLDGNTIYLDEIGSYAIVITEMDVHGNRSEAETVQVQITDGRAQP